MKKYLLSIVAITALSFGFSAQVTPVSSVLENSMTTTNGDSFEILTFNTVEEKAAWIKANPVAYAAKLNEAQQVSMTFIGTLLQVKAETKIIAEPKKIVSTSSSATSPKNN